VVGLESTGIPLRGEAILVLASIYAAAAGAVVWAGTRIFWIAQAALSCRDAFHALGSQQRAIANGSTGVAHPKERGKGPGSLQPGPTEN
jgi:hypothetical protein